MRPFVIWILAFSLVFSAELPSAAPAQNGFAADRLNRIDQVMRGHIADGHLAGASGLIARNGKIVFRETWGEYKPDTIVRMYSMTKAITGVAAMICYEEGKFSLTDPVSKYLPEFEHMRVAHEGKDASGKRIYYTVPADRQITVRDLFRHTSGLDYAGPREENGEPAYKRIDMFGYLPLVDFDLAEGMRRLASVPLNDQPGTMFRYGYSIDLLGRLVEVVSGKTLDQFFEERIYRPLGMKDSGFFVPESKWNRLAVLYSPKSGGGLERSSLPAQDSFKKKPALVLGGAGSVSTLDDYARFCRIPISPDLLDCTRSLIGALILSGGTGFSPCKYPYASVSVTPKNTSNMMLTI